MPTKKAITINHLRSLAERADDCIAEVASAAAEAIEEIAQLLGAAMTGATAQADGKQGQVPGPAAGDQTKFLRGDGTWAQPSLAGAAFTVSTSDPPSSADQIWVKAQSLS